MQQKEKYSITYSEPSYALSFLFVMVLLIIGFVLQVLIGSVDINLLSFPVNLISLLFLLLFIIIGHFKYKKSQIVIWLSSTKAAISSIVGFSLISLLMGFISQEVTSNELIKYLGLNNLAYSWVYLFSLLFLILALGFATIKRIYPYKQQNFWYILNHLGLWITLIAANFGFADQTRLRMDISTNSFNNIAYDISGNFQQLPFDIQQNNFTLENYSPKLAIIDNKTSMIDPKLKKNSFDVAENKSIIIDNWKISILKSYLAARSKNNTIISFDSVGVAPAAYVNVENTITKEIKQGWISCGNILINETTIVLDSVHSLIMLQPVQKEVSLELSIKKGETLTLKTIVVNNPQTFDGWEIYIFNFNELKGKWSKSSVIELVKEPWHPFVFLGLGMMIFGSFFVFWRGKK